MPGETDRELDEKSKEILRALDDMRAMEARKRGTQRSTVEFHALSREVDEKAREVVDLAGEELEAGESDSPLPEDRAQSGPGDWTRGSNH